MTFYLLSYSLSSTLAHSFSLSTHISSPHRLKFSSWRQTVYHTLSPCPHVQAITPPPAPIHTHTHTWTWPWLILLCPSHSNSCHFHHFSVLASCLGHQLLISEGSDMFCSFWMGNWVKYRIQKETVAALNIKRLIILEWHFMLASFVFNLPSSRPPRAGFSNNWVHYNQLLYDSSDKINKAVHQHHTHTRNKH